MSYIERVYDQSWLGRLRKKLENDSRLPVEMTAKIVPSCENLLDIGCGDGYLATLIKGKCRELTGIDISTLAISQAKRQGYNKINKIDLNEEKFPYESGYFDVVICLDVLEHLYDPEALLKEVYRITKPQGLLVVSTANIRYLKYIFALIFAGRFPSTSGDPFIYRGGHLHYFTNKDLIELLGRCGFRVSWRKGIIPSPRFKSLIPFSKVSLVMEWFSPAFILKCKKD